MNREEAKQLLVEHLQPFVARSYRELTAFVGIEHVEKFIMASGTEYYFQLDVAPVNEDDDSLVVEGLVFEVQGRKFLPPTEQASFTVTRENQFFCTSPELRQAAERAEQAGGGQAATRSEST